VSPLLGLHLTVFGLGHERETTDTGLIGIEAGDARAPPPAGQDSSALLDYLSYLLAQAF